MTTEPSRMLSPMPRWNRSRRRPESTLMRSYSRSPKFMPEERPWTRHYGLPIQ